MKHPTDDPIQALREANPYPTQAMPRHVSERLWARIEGQLDTRPAPARRWSLALGGLATSAVAAIALVLVVMGQPSTPDTGPSVALGDPAGSCLEAYSPETLPHRQLAFDGTVTEIADDPTVDVGYVITFDVNGAYIGDPGATVSVQTPGFAAGVGGDTADPAAGPGVEVRDRLLISGDDGVAWTCGFSRTWSQEMADEWEAATAATR